MPSIEQITRTTDGRLPTYAFPGAYPIIYHSMINDDLCPRCANRADADPDELPAWKPTAWEMNAFGPSFCDDCGHEIESAYGDPDPIRLRHADGTEIIVDDWIAAQELPDPDGWRRVS